MKSKLVEAIDIKDANELKLLTIGLQLHTKKVARKIFLHGIPCSVAGEQHGMTKQATYEMLKRLYYKKFGVLYNQEYHNKMKVD